MVVRSDVAVVGLGAMGAMSLWQLAERGVSVVGVERYDIAHPYGSSHGASRIFRSILFEGPEYVPVARRSLELWRELERVSDTPLLTITGGLCIGTDGGELIADAVQSADAGDVSYELLGIDVLRARFPQHACFDDDIGVYEHAAGSVNPELAIRAAVARAAELGATVQTETTVTAVEFGADRVAITCDDQTIEARAAIISAGPWFTDLVPHLELPLRNQRSILSWFAPGRDFGADRFPAFVRESHDLQGWGLPDLDGSGVKIGISGQPKPWLDRPEDNRAPVSAAETLPIESFCTRAFPELAPSRASTRRHPTATSLWARRRGRQVWCSLVASPGTASSTPRESGRLRPTSRSTERPTFRSAVSTRTDSAQCPTDRKERTREVRTTRPIRTLGEPAESRHDELRPGH